MASIPSAAGACTEQQAVPIPIPSSNDPNGVELESTSSTADVDDKAEAAKADAADEAAKDGKMGGSAEK